MNIACPSLWPRASAYLPLQPCSKRHRTAKSPRGRVLEGNRRVGVVVTLVPAYTHTWSETWRAMQPRNGLRQNGAKRRWDGMGWDGMRAEESRG
eukprot:750829-Hanusia_phi.AAC.4